MSVKMKIKNIEAINWKRDHDVPEEEVLFSEYVNEGFITVGDIVTVENSEECPLPLREGSYCLTFHKDNFFIEESFTLDECKVLFGNDFNC